MDAQHPSDSTLRSFHLGQLDAMLAAAVAGHLSTCSDCRSRMSVIASESPPRGVQSPRSGSDLPAAIGSSLTGLHVPTASGSAQPSQPDPVLDALLSHPDYRVIRELGRGGMGVVYLAENRLMGRKEVLKVVSADVLERNGVLDRFLREIRMAAMLQHRNIVTAFSASRLGPNLVLAMEYVDGPDLGRYYRAKGPLPVAHACNFIGQAASGLQHAFEKGLVHRDVKPSNLMLTRQDGPALIKVLDFGLAKANSEGAVQGGLTHSGQMLGTPYYMAPEQSIDAQKADIRADIYSLGCTLYCLLSGSPPFDGKSLYEILDAHQRLEAMPLDQIRSDVPWEVAQIAARMMAKSPDDRYQTPAEVARALAPYARKQPNPADAVGAMARMQGSKPRDRSIPKDAPTPVPGAPTRDGVVSAEPEPSDRDRSSRLRPLHLVVASVPVLISVVLGAWILTGAPVPGRTAKPDAPPKQLGPQGPAPTVAASPRPAAAPSPRAPAAPAPTIPTTPKVDLAASSPPPSVPAAPSPRLAHDGLNSPQPPPVSRDALPDAVRKESGTREEDRTIARSATATNRQPRNSTDLSHRNSDEAAREVSSKSAERATLSDVLSGGTAFQGKPVRLDDVLQIGNLPVSIKGRPESFLRVTQKKDGVPRLICTNNGQIEKYPGAFLLLDEAVSGSLTQLCSKLDLALDAKPNYYAELEVTPRGSTLLITALDLVLMNTLELAQGRYQNSFAIFHVGRSGAERLENVDDAYWYRRLGGKGLSAELKREFIRVANRQRSNAEAEALNRMYSGMLDSAARRAAEADFQMRAFAKGKGF